MLVALHHRPLQLLLEEAAEVHPAVGVIRVHPSRHAEAAMAAAAVQIQKLVRVRRRVAPLGSADTGWNLAPSREGKFEQYLGFGRIVPSEIEVPNLLANTV